MKPLKKGIQFIQEAITIKADLTNKTNITLPMVKLAINTALKEQAKEMKKLLNNYYAKTHLKENHWKNIHNLIDIVSTSKTEVKTEESENK